LLNVQALDKLKEAEIKKKLADVKEKLTVVKTHHQVALVYTYVCSSHHIYASDLRDPLPDSPLAEWTGNS
jgi:hypothetical protein